MRILIADDNHLVRRAVRQLLSSEAGWEVCGEAADGLDALQKVRELLPDFVLLDISMPGMNGFEAARLIRKEVPTVKIIVMSQHDPNLMLPRAMEAGANGCVDKGRLSTDLLPQIRRLDNRRIATDS